MSKTRPVGIRLSRALSEQHGDISSHSINRALDRYYEILRRERIERMLSESEWNALRDMLNGTVSEPAGMCAGSLAMSWADSLEDGIAEKWGLDPAGMAEKLRALTYPQELAAIEAVERWWREQGKA